MSGWASSPLPAAIAVLEAEGELVEHGGFTLDLAAARAKLADFGLAERHAYVLLLVEAAHFLPSCDAIRFSVNNTATRVVLHGVELKPSELRGLFDAVFSSRGGASPASKRAGAWPSPATARPASRVES